MTEHSNKGVRDIHAYLAEFDDIPGTRVFTARARATTSTSSR
jgi:protocatechuate 4,5-dioxygenase alpha chain